MSSTHKVLTPLDAAHAASLQYVSDAIAGITRQKRPSGYSYRDARGGRITDATETARIRAIGVPPAWTSVWISPYANGHIQATGRDLRGRKQYRYHASWQALQSEHKFGRMLDFGAAIPSVRARVNADLALADHSHTKVLAIVVRLLETTYIRIGNDEYAKTNGSFGLTTLRNEHVRIRGNSLRFDFVGKMGKVHSVRVTDRRLVGLIRRCRELPGQALFQYRNDDGGTRSIDSTEVNEYLREIAGSAFTAKDFRTWAGSLLAISLLVPRRGSGVGADGGLVPTVKDVLTAVSSQLGNTPAVCKSSYIHPLILTAYVDDGLQKQWNRIVRRSRTRVGLTREENAMLTFLASATTARNHR